MARLNIGLNRSYRHASCARKEPLDAWLLSIGISWENLYTGYSDTGQHGHVQRSHRRDQER